MILWFRRTILRQLIGLLAVSLIVAAFDYFWAPTPVLRFRFPILLQGLIAGAFIAFITLVAELAFRLFVSGYTESRRELELRFNPQKSLGILGALCFAAVGEEVFFRGYLFNSLLPQGVWVALAVHAAVILLSFALGRRYFPMTVIRFLQANFYAFAFLQTRSLTMCIAAHLVTEVVEMLSDAPLESFVRFLGMRKQRLRRSPARQAISR